MCLFLGAVAVIAILLLVFAPDLLPFIASLSNSARHDSIFVVVVLAGTMGAFFSSLQRLYDFKELPAILYQKGLVDDYVTLFAYSLVPALVGAVAAAVIYLVFAAGLLRGSFFPSFECKLSPCADFESLLSSFAPTSAEDFAKAILWGFVAGFAERLVPSLLNGFVRTATDAANKPTGDVENGTGSAGPKMSSRGLANQGRGEIVRSGEQNDYR